MRPLRLLTAVLLSVTVLALPADASTPAVSIRASSLTPVYGTAVTVSGRVTHVPTGTRIQFQRNLGTGWVTRAYLRTSSTGRWSTKYSARLGQNHLRIVVPARGSRRRVVSPQVVIAAQPRLLPQPPVANEPVTVTGALRTAGSRPVQVQVYRGGTATTTTARTRSSGGFTIMTELPGTSRVRIIAPAAVIGSTWLAAFSTPWQTVEVTGAEFRSAAAPVISGEARVGSTLGATTPGWDPDVQLAYQWSRSGVTIAGATTTSYVVSAADVGKTLSVTATGALPGYRTETRTSAATSSVLPGLLHATSLPLIDGTAVVGSNLTVQTAIWGPGVSQDCQWLRDGLPVDGATTCSHLVTNADAGRRLAVTVTGHKDGWTAETLTSAETALVTGGTLSSTPVPTITGSPVFGGHLAASTGTWDKDVALTYAWRRGGTLIPGADASTYDPVLGDVGTSLSVRVTGTKLGYDSVARTSQPTAPVAKGTLDTAEPVVSGNAESGEALTVAPGDWGPGAVQLTYRWLRDDVPIPGATSAAYTVTDADRGSLLAAQVTGAEDGYVTASRTSDLRAVPGPQSASKIARALRTFHAALDDVGHEPVDIFVGPSDSLADGTRATSIQKRWISVFRDDLRAGHQPAGVEGGFGYLDPFNWGQFPDNPISYVNGIGAFEQGLGRQTLALFGADQTITVRDRFTDLDIVYSGYTGDAGAFTYSVDDGPEVRVSTGGRPATRGGYVERVSGLTAGDHELVMHGAGGGNGNPAIIEGVMLYSGDRASGVRVWEGGASARTARDYVAPGEAWATSLKEVHPDLVVVPIGSNDYALGVSAAETEGRIREIIATIRSHVDTDPSIILMPYYDRPAAGEVTWAEYEEMYARIAATDPDIAVFDLAPLFGAYGSAERSALMAADHIHPSDTGYALIAEKLTEFVGAG